MGQAKLGGPGLESFMRFQSYYQLGFLFSEGLPGARESASKKTHSHMAASRRSQFLTTGTPL